MNPLEDPDRPSEQGTPTRPFHVSVYGDWNEQSKKLEDYIRDSKAFEGKWQSYISNYCLIIPEELQQLFDGGGVLTVSTENHLMLFGNVHWSRLQRLLAKDVGLSPVNNELARHIYSHMHKFNKLNENGSINIPLELAEYAGLTKDVAIIGMIYHAEIHDLQSYKNSSAPENKQSLLERFKQMRNN